MNSIISINLKMDTFSEKKSKLTQKNKKETTIQ